MNADTENTAGRPRSKQSQRIPLWDNARFLCVTLVVIGHAIQRLTYEDEHALVLYLFIYAFHMPAFAIISGYFSKPGPPSVRQMKTVVTDILLPYLIMEAIWTLVQFLVEGKEEFNPSKPSWTLWFLLALAFFRLVLPYLAILRWPLLVALLLSLGVGYFVNVDSTFSLSRAIGILPFFVLGWKAREWGIVDRWRSAERHIWWIRMLSVAVFASWLAVVWINIDFWREMTLKYWFFYDDSYADIGDTSVWAALVRLAVIGLAVVLSAAFFTLVPRRKTWMTGLGQATMYIYLLHSFVLYPLRQTPFLREHSTTLWLAIMIVLSIAISILLASRPVRRLFRPLIEPKPKWIFARSGSGDADGGSARSGESRTDPTGSRRR